MNTVTPPLSAAQEPPLAEQLQKYLGNVRFPEEQVDAICRMYLSEHAMDARYELDDQFKAHCRKSAIDALLAGGIVSYLQPDPLFDMALQTLSMAESDDFQRRLKREVFQFIVEDELSEHQLPGLAVTPETIATRAQAVLGVFGV